MCSLECVVQENLLYYILFTFYVNIKLLLSVLLKYKKYYVLQLTVSKRSTIFITKYSQKQSSIWNKYHKSQSRVYIFNEIRSQLLPPYKTKTIPNNDQGVYTNNTYRDLFVLISSWSRREGTDKRLCTTSSLHSVSSI